MQATIVDIITGNIFLDPSDLTLWDYSHGSYSCDCNRCCHSGVQDNSEFCLGSERYVVVDVQGDYEGLSKNEIMEQINSDYDVSTVEKAFNIYYSNRGQK